MKITSSSEFGKAVRTQRKAMGYTQAYVSEMTGLSISFISDVENGKPTVELGKVLDLASLVALDCSLSPRTS